MDKKTVKPLEELIDKIRGIDGFPKAKDEDILELSNPPFYTACPNPYIKKFIEEYGNKYDPTNDEYNKTPFIGDISEGKNDPLYMAHSYHTKVPHKAIMKFIEHYTEPGDIVFDGFCGTGMTGVAAQILKRKAILSEISPIATFISHNYTHYLNQKEIKKKISTILDEIDLEYGWLYETNHVPHSKETRTGKQAEFLNFNERKKGRINYTVWSDVLQCPYCNNEYVFYEAAIDKNSGRFKKKYICPKCKAEIQKIKCKKATKTFYDSAISKEIRQIKKVPVLINYSVAKKRFEKPPDQKDFSLIKKIEKMEIPYWFPINRMPIGDESRRNDKYGITHLHHFFTKRNLWILSALWQRAKTNKLKFLITSSIINLSKLYRFRTNRKGGAVSGTLYIPSTIQENNAIDVFRRKVKDVIFEIVDTPSIKTTQSITSLENIPKNSVDYIFTDPPFGSNLMYSELNFIWEAWLKIFTNNKHEAIINTTQKKRLNEYTALMHNGFREMYRILKPNRWITVEFHNSKASVWNAIQESMARAGFLIAQVAILDKKQGSFKQVNSAGAVKNDLIINAYKPKTKFQEKFLSNAGEDLEVTFIREQLSHLPIQPNIERTEKMLYSKMLAHYVQNGFKIKYNSTNFYQMLSDNFVELDGYWFLEEQVKEYNKWKSGLNLDELKRSMSTQQSLFVSDEKSALTWLYHYLKKPKTYGDIFTAYQQVAITTQDAIPELRELLDNNFILENRKYRRPLNKEEKEEINQNRDKELDRAFNKLLTRAKEQRGKIKQVRREALIHGFTKCYQQGRYNDIITIADKLYTGTLESSGEIMDFVDIARIKTKGKKNIEDF